MIHFFDNRASDAAFVDFIWSSQSVGGGTFMSSAASNLEMVITKQKDKISFGVRGPETHASPAPVPEDAEIFGIVFKLGTFLPHLPISQLVNGGIQMPDASSCSFWMQGSAWEIPRFDNADTFVEKLVRQGLLAHEPLVDEAMKGQIKDLSLRSVQRRFIRATGIPHTTIYQIERARQARTLLEQGVSILDTMEQLGYYDQPHMTRMLKHLIGQTPAQIINTMTNE